MLAAVRIVVLVGAALSLGPSVMPYTVERSEGDRVCVAVWDGWHRARPEPSSREVQEVLAALEAPIPPPEEMRDPAVRREFLAAERRRQASPGFRRASAYIDWADGAGACIAQAHRRLSLSGAGLSLAAVVGALLVTVDRRSRVADASS